MKGKYSFKTDEVKIQSFPLWLRCGNVYIKMKLYQLNRRPMKKLLFLVFLICLSVLACSGNEDSNPGKSSAETTINDVSANESEKQETVSEAVELQETSEMVYEEEEEIAPPPPVIEDVSVEVIEGFIDDVAWNFIGQGFDIIQTVGESESIESLQKKLDEAAAFMTKAKPAFLATQTSEGLEGYSYYPLGIIEIYEKTAAAYKASGGDPTSLSALSQADDLLVKLVSLVEEGRNE